MQFRSLLLAVAVLAALPTPAGAQQEGLEIVLVPPAIAQGMSDAEIAAGLDPWLSGLQREGRFSGVVLVARNGQEIYRGAYGETDLETHTAVSADTRFPVASIGKLFTHVAVLQLIQAGRLTPETTVGDIIPDYPQAATRSATITQLLQHRGGVADIFGPAFRDAPKEEFRSNTVYYRFVSTQPPMFPPGEREEYCNGCFVVLGEIIARVSGQSYEDYVAQHVFAPVGMTRTGFFRRDALPDNTAHFTGRPRGPDGPLVDVSRFHGLSGNAAGDAYSTVRDLLAFDNALREHRLVNAALTAQILRSEPEGGRATARVGFAGGGPGVNGVIFGNGAWTLIVLTNREPPLAETMPSVMFPLLAGPAAE